MSCDFYTYKGGTLFGDFYCMKKEDTINMDTYNRYCKNYNYKECPIYKSGNSSGCYLTSACIFAKGLKDDCHELTTLRQFRDQWLAKTTKGKGVSFMENQVGWHGKAPNEEQYKKAMEELRD